VLVVLLQAQPLQVMPQEIKGRALRANANTSRDAFIVVLTSPGAFRGHIIITLRPSADIFNSPLANESIQPNLTSYCDGLFRFLPKNTDDLRSQYLFSYVTFPTALP